MIRITAESNYSEVNEFANVDGVELEVGRVMPERSINGTEAYPSVAEYVAALLDIPVSAVVID